MSRMFAAIASRKPARASGSVSRKVSNAASASAQARSRSLRSAPGKSGSRARPVAASTARKAASVPRRASAPIRFSPRRVMSCSSR
jgi:hypothetical protein